jgi:hypothetical protein
MRHLTRQIIGLERVFSPPMPGNFFSGCKPHIFVAAYILDEFAEGPETSRFANYATMQPDCHHLWCPSLPFLIKNVKSELCVYQPVLDEDIAVRNLFPSKMGQGTYCCEGPGLRRIIRLTFGFANPGLVVNLTSFTSCMNRW